jgi:hypothetical protein
MAKKRIIVDYKTLSQEILERIVLMYPGGFDDSIIKYTDAKGNKVSAIPVETEDIYYLVKVGVRMREMVEDVDAEEIDPDDYMDDLIMPEDSEEDPL